MFHNSSLPKPARTLFILSFLTFFLGLYLGFKDDNWGWWYIPLTLMIIGLSITMRTSATLKKPAKFVLVLIGSALTLLAMGMIGFMILMSGFEF